MNRYRPRFNAIPKINRSFTPWYQSKTKTSVADMLAWCRRLIIAEKYHPQHFYQPTPNEIAAVQLAWAQAAA